MILSPAGVIEEADVFGNNSLFTYLHALLTYLHDLSTYLHNLLACLHDLVPSRSCWSVNTSPGSVNMPPWSVNIPPPPDLLTYFHDTLTHLHELLIHLHDLLPYLHDLFTHLHDLLTHLHDLLTHLPAVSPAGVTEEADAGGDAGEAGLWGQVPAGLAQPGEEGQGAERLPGAALAAGVSHVAAGDAQPAAAAARGHPQRGGRGRRPGPDVRHAQHAGALPPLCEGETGCLK